jgi:hypothetical protein
MLGIRPDTGFDLPDIRTDFQQKIWYPAEYPVFGIRLED